MKNPYDLTPIQFEQEVRNAVKGSSTVAEAEERLKQRFSPQPLFWVQERGELHFGVLVQQRIGAENVDIICER
jgi:hypothetical protein